jgi:hypothetical protein
MQRFMHKGYGVSINIYGGGGGSGWGVIAKVEGFNGSFRDITCDGECERGGRKFEVDVHAKKDISDSELRKLEAEAKKKVKALLDKHLSEKHKPKK